MEHEKNLERPQIGSAKVPLWIKIMWAFGIAWIIGYALLGLQFTPKNW